MADIPALILTGLRISFLHPEDMPSALILDLTTDEGEQRFVLPCDPVLDSETVEQIGDEFMDCLDRLIAPSDDEDEEEEDEDGEDEPTDGSDEKR
ncbi:hypothetical protein [Roseixanthobacter liquoris]|uniref:hypothetical protein n=1 Tax=Roseixanthobacter liquoris TaxID=3119921 RepID=UPI00372C90E9